MARRLPIITHPNNILRQKAQDVSSERIQQAEFQKFLDDMTKTMLEADGIGLAAVQVASRENVAVINMEDGPMHLLNPRIVSYGKKKELAVEACLSVPGLAGEVKRSLEIVVEALDRSGRPLAFDAEHLLARVIQHEVDHLNGILYIDRAERIWRDQDKSKPA